MKQFLAWYVVTMPLLVVRISATDSYIASPIKRKKISAAAEHRDLTLNGDHTQLERPMNEAVKQILNATTVPSISPLYAENTPSSFKSSKAPSTPDGLVDLPIMTILRKNGSSDSKKASLLMQEKEKMVATPVSHDIKLGKGVAAVGVALKSGRSANKHVPESKRQETLNMDHILINGGLKRALPWNKEESSSVKADQLMPILGSNRLSDNLALLNEAPILLAQSREQVGNDREKEPNRMVDGLTEGNEETIVDETVRWNQDGCHPCDVPTQLPAPPPHQDDENHRSLPNVIDKNEPWRHANDSMLTKNSTKPHLHCTKIVENYGETYDCSADHTESPTPASTQVPSDKTCTDIFVEGDATYCIHGPICSGSDTNPGGSLCPAKGDVAVKGCSNDALPSWTSTGICVAPANATCLRLKSGTRGCVFSEASFIMTNSTYSSTQTRSDIATPAPSYPSYTVNKSTPTPVQPHDVTPARTIIHDEPSPKAVASTPESGLSTSSSASTTTGAFVIPYNPIRSPITTPLKYSGDFAHKSSGTIGTGVKVSQISTSKGTSSSKVSNDLSGGAIAGISIACTFFVTIIVGAVLLKQRSLARQREEDLFADISAPDGRPLMSDYGAM